jgi:hypothetical protein
MRGQVWSMVLSNGKESWLDTCLAKGVHLLPKRDIYIEPHPSSASFPLKKVTEKHQTVITTSMHNAAKA